ncbi:membrane peptidoglycan carboxypeptidase [Tamaricihabitans halophyticus]|uniref:Membrane peptidoglycan carboxypeptidase n=2 Tax=Tamaricihabitans halophyticus TaxID=1262583 RepID=A0A4R2R5T1_9PSEU|nr:membrane peptidoglycan carboxypeptidase [Tamaricihabitans halophyticus]
MVDRPTELLPPIQSEFGAAPESSGLGREPELLTHSFSRAESNREQPTEWDDEWDDEDDDPDDDPEVTDEERAKRKKKVWRRVRRTIYVLAALFILGPLAAFGIAYMLVDVPTPEEVAAQQSQAVTLQYSDGSEMSKIIPDEGNRTIVQPDDIPEHVKQAAYAAEDASFETNAGFDIKAIFRAAWNQVSGGVGGGSTITQQYIKKATENEEYSYQRKALEVVKAFKMNNEQSKEEIITAYLNTIYFGRGANGVQAAAKAWFNKDIGDVNPSEAALLAGMIQSPGRADDEEYQQQRWKYVIGQMVDKGWLTPQEGKAEFPKIIPAEQARQNLNRAQGPEGLIERQVLRELETKAGMDESQVQTAGLTIKTTIDPKAQRAATEAVNEVMADQPENLKEALVAVNPKTGGVMAYYGGESATGLDYAQSMQEPGSSFKPFDLAAALKMGHGLGETYDGSSPRTIAGTEVSNSEGVDCGECSVATAMERSINTVFVDMAVNTTGTRAVADAAHEAGIPKEINGKKTLEGANGGAPDANIAIGGGLTQVRTIDMASAYATFAAAGEYRTPHLIDEAKNSEGQVVHVGESDAKPAFDQNAEKSKQIAGNVTNSLEPVVPYSSLACPGDWDCAGKTGTHQYVSPDGEKTSQNAKAWMVGYTPSISSAVWVGADQNEPIVDAAGANIYGSGLPGSIWQSFMETYLADKPGEQFEDVEPIGTYAEAGAEYTPESTEPSLPPSTSSAPPPTTSSEARPSRDVAPTSEAEPPPSGEPPPSDDEPPTGGGDDSPPIIGPDRGGSDRGAEP